MTQHAVNEAPTAYRVEQNDWSQFWPAEREAPLHYYRFEYLDRLEFMRSARDHLPTEGADMILAQVAAGFRAKGWEGDGSIEIFWLPPFIVKLNDTAGFIVFHVKQQNNGTSFLASPYPLPGLE